MPLAAADTHMKSLQCHAGHPPVCNAVTNSDMNKALTSGIPRRRLHFQKNDLIHPWFQHSPWNIPAMHMQFISLCMLHCEQFT